MDGVSDMVLDMIGLISALAIVHGGAVVTAMVAGGVHQFIVLLYCGIGFGYRTYGYYGYNRGYAYRNSVRYNINYNNNIYNNRRNVYAYNNRSFVNNNRYNNNFNRNGGYNGISW